MFYTPLLKPVRIGDQVWPVNTVPRLSVCCIAYNHERFIRDALDGFLMQETTFPVEIVVRDDASTDRTQAVISEYENRNGRLFKTIFHKENQHVLGKRAFLEVFAIAEGDFIAICEGDDYWIHPLKLERQVRFLEANPHYPFCFHPILARNEARAVNRPDSLGAPGRRTEYRLDDLLESNFIGTPSVVFRNNPRLVFPGWYGDCPFGDLPLHLLNLCRASQEAFGCLPEEMAVYRRHGGGMYQGASDRVNAERTTQTYRLAGRHLGLCGRRSFRMGLANAEVLRCRASQTAGDYAGALEAAISACRIAPPSRLVEVACKVTLVLFPRLRRELLQAGKMWRLSRAKWLGSRVSCGLKRVLSNFRRNGGEVSKEFPGS